MQIRTGWRTLGMVDDTCCCHCIGADEWRNSLQGYCHARQRSIGETLECSVSNVDEKHRCISTDRRLLRGAGHHLLEHPDKDGNMPLMHACAKLDIG